MMGFDMKFGFGICIYNEEETSWVSDEVWICINKEIKINEAEKWWGLIQSFDLTYIHDQTKRKKTLGFWMKCGFEINKEIKRNEAEKWWVLIKCYICMIRQSGRKILSFGRSVDLKLTKK